MMPNPWNVANIWPEKPFGHTANGDGITAAEKKLLRCGLTLRNSASGKFKLNGVRPCVRNQTPID
jgi:hypothetical protein